MKVQFSPIVYCRKHHLFTSIQDKKMTNFQLLCFSLFAISHNSTKSFFLRRNTRRGKHDIDSDINTQNPQKIMQKWFCIQQEKIKIKKLFEFYSNQEPYFQRISHTNVGKWKFIKIKITYWVGKKYFFFLSLLKDDMVTETKKNVKIKN